MKRSSRRRGGNLRGAFLIFFVLLFSPWVSADTIVLKSGNVIEGTIVQETPIFVRVRTQDSIETQEFLQELIQTMTKSDPSTPEPGAIENKRNVAETVAEGREPRVESPGVVIKPVVKSLGVMEQSPVTMTGSYSPAAESSSPALETPSGPSRELKGADARKDITLNNASLQEMAESNFGKGLPVPDESSPSDVPSTSKAFPVTLRDSIIAGAVFIFLGIITVFMKRKASRKIEEKASVPEQSALSQDKPDAGGAPVSENKPAFQGRSTPQVTEETLKRHSVKRKEKSVQINFWKEAPRVFIYPLRGNVLSASIGGTVFFTGINIAMYAPFYGIIACIMFVCYTIASMVKIIETAVTTEREDLYDWPDFLDWFDWVGKAILFLLAWGISYAPAIAYVVLLKRVDGWLFGLIGLGIFIAPMYTLSISLVGGFGSLNIINIFKSIAHTFFPYLATVIFWVLTQYLNFLAYYSPLTKIPMWGGVVRWFIFVYFLFVNMRLLGIFYKAHRLKLGWYGEAE
ncbi:MAG TPA: hypothetical protein DD723_00325 [Candidatus Omnitrophica bacterium]|nr:MAG: hypothetical protein A2Z81_04595 [Omnitrophica WOR_2 bacterium GWA2_45_18]HBR13977.1 hypothetical protein [Candidatus Omnitrophota bacterium]